MRLGGVHLYNFLTHANTIIDLSRPVTVIAGRNGSGKTSIADAIKYALIGRCRSTDAAGRGADQLIRRGAESAHVGLNASIEGQALEIQRGPGSAILKWKGQTVTGSQVNAVIQSILGAPVDLVEAVLDAPSWFDLPAARQSEILAGVLQLSYPHAEIEREARALGLSDPAVMALVGGLGRMAVGRESYGPEILEALYQSAYEKRAAAKKDLKDLEAQVKANGARGPAPKDDEIQAQADLVRQLEDQVGALRETIGSLRTRAQQRDRLAAAIAETERGLAKAKAAVTERPKPAQLSLSSSVSAKDLDVQIAEMERTQGGLQAAHQEAITARREQNQRMDTLENEIVAIEQGQVACPSIHAPAACPLSEASLAERKGKLPAMKKQLGRHKSALTAAAEDVRKRAEELESCEFELRKLYGLRSQMREDQARQRGATEGEIEALEERLAMQQADLDALGDPQAELRAEESRLFAMQRDLTEARTAGEGMLAAQKAATASESLSLKALEARGRVDLLEELCRVLEPRQLPSLLLARGAAPILERINAQLARMAPEYSVAVRIEKGLALEVLRQGTDGPLPIENLSSSERLRVGIAFAFALSVLSGLRVLVIDNADMLDRGNLDQLVTSINAMTDAGIESVVIILTRDEVRTISTAAVGSYWIEAGTARELVVPTGATA